MAEGIRIINKRNFRNMLKRIVKKLSSIRSALAIKKREKTFEKRLNYLKNGNRDSKYIVK